MVLRIKPLHIIAFALVFLLSVPSCDKKMFVIVDCGECTADEPGSAKLLIKVNSRPPLSSITVKVFEGTDTDSAPILTYTAISGDEKRVDAALNRTYTAVAEYRYGGKTYRVIDSVRPSVKFTKTDCDQECYYVYNYRLNLSLKYF